MKRKRLFFRSVIGVFCTAWARNNLLRNLVALDPYVVYSDTDSLKLKKGYDRSVIDKYNESVIKRIKRVSEELDIPIEKFAPKDKDGKTHMLGLFDFERNICRILYSRS